MEQGDSDWGEVIYSYTRAQAIADGELVDISATPEWKEAGFRYPGAMSRAAWAEAIERGGQWKRVTPPDGYESYQVLELPPGQDLKGRLWDVMTMLRYAIDRQKETDRVHFHVSVSGTIVRLWCLVGPGDTPEPVMTIMLKGED